MQADQYYQELTTLTTQQHALDNESFFTGRYILFNRIRLAAIAIDEGELVQADAELTASEHHARFYRDREQLAYTLGLRSQLSVQHGSLELAKETLTEAIDIFERLGIRREAAEAREELARLDAQTALMVE